MWFTRVCDATQPEAAARYCCWYVASIRIHGTVVVWRCACRCKRSRCAQHDLEATCARCICRGFRRPTCPHAGERACVGAGDAGIDSTVRFLQPQMWMPVPTFRGLHLHISASMQHMPFARTRGVLLSGPQANVTIICMRMCSYAWNRIRKMSQHAFTLYRA
jgi:hypothetical protein